MKDATEITCDSKDEFSNDVSTKEKTHEKSGEAETDDKQIKTT